MLNAHKIVCDVLKRYSECRSYSDNGTVRRTNQSNGLILFQTKYVRPNRFLFEWVEVFSIDSSVPAVFPNRISFDGTDCYASYEFRPETKVGGKFADEIHASAGVSSGASNLVLPLLISGLEPNFCNLKSARDFTVKGSRSLAGVPFYILEGTIRSERDLEFWIDEVDLSIKKISERVIVTPEMTARVNAKLSTVPAILGSARAPSSYFVEYDFDSVLFDSEIDQTAFTQRHS